jgi:bacillithiol biosynthesis cysteine-adding enzyme BshC
VGSGCVSLPYLLKGAHVVGLDASAQMLSDARIAHPEFHMLDVHDPSQPLTTVGFGSSTLDVIVSSRVLDRATDMEALIGGAMGALEDGGTLAFCYLQPECSSPEDVERMLARQGMQLRRHESFVARDEGVESEHARTGLVVATKPGRAPTIPAALAAMLDRTACVDRRRILDIDKAPLLQGPLTTRMLAQGAEADHRREIDAMMASLEQMLARQEIAPKEIPLPTTTPEIAQRGQPGCDALMLFAHPDDESIYAGLTTSELTRSGYSLEVIHTTGGGGGRRFGLGDDDLASVRRHESMQALGTLGLDHYGDLGLEDFGKYRDAHKRVPLTALETLERWGASELLERMVRAIRTHRPRTLLSFDPERDPNYSLHGHHLATGLAAMIAFHLAADPHSFPEHIAEGLAPWAPERHQTIEPQHALSDRITDIEGDVSDKLAAVGAHASQRYSTEALIRMLEDAPGGRTFERWHLLQSRTRISHSEPLARLMGTVPPEEKRIRAARMRPRISAVDLLPSTDPLLTALRDRSPSIEALYRIRPHEQIRREIASHAYPREGLCDLLRAQNLARGASSRTLDNIEALRSAETVAIVTGQQVGLFGGPLYALFKALGAINEAERLRHEGVRAVPLFWLASYDHDFREVNEAKLIADDVVQLSLDEKHELLPVGDIPLGESVARILDQAEKALGDAPFAREVMNDLRAIYTPDATFAGAFAKWMGKLTDRYGLVLLDPNRRAFNTLARPLLEKELFGAPPSSAAIEAASAEMSSLGFEPQIRSRGEMLNLFFIDDRGRRVTLKRKGEGFETGGVPKELDAPTVRRYLEESPERFSPSGLLRPVLEDWVIPTAAYIGGPSERRYYGQLAGTYEWAGLPVPAVLARPQFSIARKADLEKLEAALGEPAQSVLRADNMNERIGRAGVPPAIAEAYARFAPLRQTLSALNADLDRRMANGEKATLLAEVQSMKAELAQIVERARAAAQKAGIDRLDRGLEVGGAKIAEALGSLGEEIGASDATRGRSPSHRSIGAVSATLGGFDDQLVKVGRAQNRDLMTLMARLRPRGEPQERAMSIAQLMADFGPGIIDLLVQRAIADQAAPELIAVDADPVPHRDRDGRPDANSKA